jgi:hypothetical protein
MVMSGQSATQAGQHVLDDGVQDFLKKHMNSLVKWDLIRFFHDNPHTKDTAENIAQYTGRDIVKVEHELKGLAAAQVLQVNDIAGVTVYQLGSDEHIRQTINGFMEACHNRAFRTEAIQHVIQCMQQVEKI